MRITRIIEYDGSPEWLEKQLGKSMPDGLNEFSEGKISILTVGNIPMLAVHTDIIMCKLKVSNEIPS